MADGGRSNTDIARRLRALMLAMNQNQVGFATMIGISQPALNNYLKGLRRPDLDVAIAIQMKTKMRRLTERNDAEEWIIADEDRNNAEEMDHCLKRRCRRRF